MDELLREMLEMGVGAAVDSAGAGDQNEAVGGTTDDGEVGPMLPEALMVEQVRVIDEEGGLRVVYPARTDLRSDGYDVKRD